MLHIRSKLVERFFVEIIWKKNSWQISQCQHHLQPMSWLPWGMPAWTTCKPLNMGAFFPVVCLTRLNPWWNCPKECAFKSFREPHISSLTVLHPDSIAKLLLLEIPTWAHDMHWQRAPQTCLAFLNISYGTTCYIAFPCISCCLMLSWCCLSITWMAMYGNAWRVFGDAAIWRNISRSRINCSTCMRSICLKDAWSTGAYECLGLYMPLSSLYDRFTIGLLQGLIGLIHGSLGPGRHLLQSHQCCGNTVGTLPCMDEGNQNSPERTCWYFWHYIEIGNIWWYIEIDWSILKYIEIDWLKYEIHWQKCNLRNMKQNSRGVPRDTDRMMIMLLVLLVMMMMMMLLVLVVVVVVGQTDGRRDGRADKQTDTGEISEIPSSPSSPSLRSRLCAHNVSFYLHQHCLANLANSKFWML